MVRSPIELRVVADYAMDGADESVSKDTDVVLPHKIKVVSDDAAAGK